MKLWEGTGCPVTGSPVTGCPVTGCPVTGCPVKRCPVTCQAGTEGRQRCTSTQPRPQRWKEVDGKEHAPTA
jgi:hypothetical protein